MNKKLKSTNGASNPYRTFSLTKVTAPVKTQNDPKCHVIKSNSDLRCRGGK